MFLFLCVPKLKGIKVQCFEALGYAESYLKVVRSYPRFRHPTTGKFFVNLAVNGFLFESEKGRAAKREGLALLFLFCSQGTAGL